MHGPLNVKVAPVLQQNAMKTYGIGRKAPRTR
jgi:hypothetical protein